jgi:hypothetical protein
MCDLGLRLCKNYETRELDEIIPYTIQSFEVKFNPKTHIHNQIDNFIAVVNYGLSKTRLFIRPEIKDSDSN